VRVRDRRELPAGTSRAMAAGMRTMTMMLLATALLLSAGCPQTGDAPQDANFSGDLPVSCGGPFPVCLPAAEQSMTLRCDYGVDTQCHSTHGYDCTCVCTGYWECDQVKIVCDPDAGAPHD
jgi:hypothetical protein